MKLNKLVNSLLTASCLSLSISACIPNAGDDNDPTRTGNNSYESTHQLSSPSLVAKNNKYFDNGFKNYMVKGFLDSILSGGIFSFPASFGFGLLTNYLNGLITGDPNKPILDKLEAMDAKLDKLQKSMDIQLNMSGTLLETVRTFYEKQMKKNLLDKIAVVTRDKNNIQIKYRVNYENKKAFENFTADQDNGDALFNYAKDNCKYETLAAIGAKNALSIAVDKQNYQNTRLKANIDQTHDIAIIYETFKANYATNMAGDGELLNNFKVARNDYVDTLMRIRLDGDVMPYVDYFNKEVLILLSNIYGPYQQIYNMELTNLAYRYACGADVSSSLYLADLPPSMGLNGYKQATERLNSQYNQTFESMQTILSEKVKPITQAELYKEINTKLFRADRPFLAESNFSDNIDSINKCNIMNLAFERVSGQEYTAGSRLVHLKAKCLIKKNAISREYVNAEITAPYYQEGNRIIRYPFSGIYFDPEQKRLKVSDQSGNTATDLKNDDVIDGLCNARNDIDRWNNNDKVADDHYENQYNGGRYYQAFDIDMSPSIFTSPTRYSQDRDLPGLPPKTWTNIKDGSGGKISSSKVFVAKVDNPSHDVRIVNYLAMAGSQPFCIRLQGFHYYSNKFAQINFGINCIGKDCKRETKEKLYLGNHTWVETSGKYTGEYNDSDQATNGIGKWKINATLPSPSIETIKSK